MIPTPPKIPIDPLPVFLRASQTLAVLLLMLASALLAALIAPEIKFHDPLFISWTIAELLALPILVVLLVESIFAFAYDLRPWGSVNFQGVKTGLWGLVVLVGIVGLVASRQELHPRVVGGVGRGFWGRVVGFVFLFYSCGNLHVGRQISFLWFPGRGRARLT